MGQGAVRGAYGRRVTGSNGEVTVSGGLRCVCHVFTKSVPHRYLLLLAVIHCYSRQLPLPSATHCYLPLLSHSPSLTVTYRYFSRETTCAKPSREMDGMKPPKEASGPKMEVVASRYGSSAKLREKRSSKEYAISADPATQSTAGAQGQGAQAQSNARAREHAQPDGDRRLQSLR